MINLSEILFQFDEPTSRLYYLNIIFSVGFILAYFIIAKNPSGIFIPFKNSILNRRYWLNKSTKHDYYIFICNGILKVFVLVPLLEATFWISTAITKIFYSFWPDFSAIELTTGPVVLITLFAFVFDDLLRFCHHLIMHKVPFLWNFHKVHHSARILTPITLYRAHPVEVALAVLRNSISLGITTSFFVVIFSQPLNLWTLFGVNGFGFIFNLLAANLRHSQIPIQFGPLEHLFISPLQHQIHHAKNKEFHDKNFGVCLSIWDKLNKSWISSREVEHLRFGIKGPYPKTFFSLLLEPFRN